jgi:hypothetical protein
MDSHRDDLQFAAILYFDDGLATNSISATAHIQVSGSGRDLDGELDLGGRGEAEAHGGSERGVCRDVDRPPRGETEINLRSRDPGSCGFGASEPKEANAAGHGRAGDDIAVGGVIRPGPWVGNES